MLHATKIYHFWHTTGASIAPNCPSLGCTSDNGWLSEYCTVTCLHRQRQIVLGLFWMLCAVRGKVGKSTGPYVSCWLPRLRVFRTVRGYTRLPATWGLRWPVLAGSELRVVDLLPSSRTSLAHVHLGRCRAIALRSGAFLARSIRRKSPTLWAVFCTVTPLLAFHFQS